MFHSILYRTPVISYPIYRSICPPLDVLLIFLDSRYIHHGFSYNLDIQSVMQTPHAHVSAREWRATMTGLLILRRTAVILEVFPIPCPTHHFVHAGAGT